MSKKTIKNTKYTSQKQWEELLFQAVNTGNFDEVKNLVTGENQPSSPINEDIPSTIVINLDCVDKERCTPLHRAAAKNFSKIVYFLMEHGANPNSKNVLQSTPLHYAAASGAKDATEALLNCEAEKNERDENGYAPIHLATKNCHHKTLKALVDGGVDINCKRRGDGFTSLHYAVQQGDMEAVEILLNGGAMLSIRDDEGCTPVLRAFATYNDIKDSDVLIKQIKVLSHLIQKDMDQAVKARDNQRHSVIHKAAISGNSQFFRTFSLIVPREIYKKMVNEKDKNNSTPLHLAAYYGHKEVTECLLTLGASVNATDGKGNTPLHIAALQMMNVPSGGKVKLLQLHQKKYYDVAEVLISHGAKKTAKNRNKQTPETIFKELGFLTL